MHPTEGCTNWADGCLKYQKNYRVESFTLNSQLAVVVSSFPVHDYVASFGTSSSCLPHVPFMIHQSPRTICRHGQEKLRKTDAMLKSAPPSGQNPSERLHDMMYSRFRDMLGEERALAKCSTTLRCGERLGMPSRRCHVLARDLCHPHGPGRDTRPCLARVKSPPRGPGDLGRVEPGGIRRWYRQPRGSMQ